MEENLKAKPYQTDEEKIREFQRKVYLKAKQEKDFKFYILYDKIKMIRFLKDAYKRVKANKGKCGVDNMTFEKIKEYGEDKYLYEIQKELETKMYKPSPVLRVYIPKSNGKQRPLGIPTIKDRIVQMSCKMVIEPIFEADFEDSSYGFRPKRSAKQAIKKIKEELKEGNTEILDADLSSYFDSIPHDKLMILIKQRISDNDVLRLIKMWLKAPVKENGKMSGGKKNRKGTPQGGVISPLLSNIYLHLIDKIINKKNGIFKKVGISIIRYADDFVLMGKRMNEKIKDKLKEILKRMDLELNEDKTRIINAVKMPFDFLGFTIRYDKDLYGTTKRYWNIIPSRKSRKKVRENIKDFLNKSRHFTPYRIAKGLNEIIIGWINYFNIPKTSYPQEAKRDLRKYLCCKLYRFYKKKSQRKCKLYRQNAFEVLVNKHKLIDPSDRVFFGMTPVNVFR